MKKALIIILTILVVLMATACSTSMSVLYNQPSNINMSRYRHIAIASTTSYDSNKSYPSFIRNTITDKNVPAIDLILASFDIRTVSKNMTKSTTNMVNRAFSANQASNYYTILGNEQTDTYLSLSKIGKNALDELKAAGYDAVVIPKITSLDVDEWITAEMVKVYYKNTNTYVDEPRYYINRTISGTITVSVVDTTTGQIVTQRTYSSKVEDRDRFQPAKNYFFQDIYSSYLIDDLTGRMIGSIIDDFVPTVRRTSISLMSNKPKFEMVKPAYEAAKNGNLDFALRLFADAYMMNGHIPSGYNAAVIMAAQNNISDAIILTKDMLSKTGSKKVVDLYSKLMHLQEMNEKAASQLEASDSKEAYGSSSVLDYLLK